MNGRRPRAVRRRYLHASVGVIVLMAAVSGLFASSRALFADAREREMPIVAHRGASGYAPENTIAAFDMAVRLQADYIELDVRMSKDGELVVMHDDTVERTTTGSGYVQAYTLQEIKLLASRTADGYVVPQEKVPTLKEVLTRYHGAVGLVIEVKTSPFYPGLEDQLVEVLSRYRKPYRMMIQSFDAEAVRYIHARLPHIPVGVLIGEKQHPLTDEALDGIASFADYINYNHEILDRRIVDRIHDRHRKVMAWTIRQVKDMRRVKRLGVDGIITDYPDWGARPEMGGAAHAAESGDGVRARA